MLEWEWRFLLTEHDLAQVRCPVLVLAGERDSQISARKDVSAIERALRAGNNRDVAVTVFANLNHLFQPCERGGPTEYEDIDVTIDTAVLDTISEWRLAKLQVGAG